MSSTVALHQTVFAQQLAGAMNLTIGQVVEVNADDQLLVNYPGCSKPIVACLLNDVLTHEDVSHVELPVSVLLAVSTAETDLPIIIGRIGDHLSQENQTIQNYEIDLPAPSKRNVSIDGKQVMLEAQEELVLSCGKSSITLKKNGKVVIKGMDLVSRAARSNKIKGASVNIN